MIKKILIPTISIFFVGCGADSDLLRDDSIANKPKGVAYKILENKVYKYKKIDELQIGFEYLMPNKECTDESCSLIKDNYLLFNGESKKLPLDSKLVLSTHGWYEKSMDSECEVTFSGKKITKRCPDGTEQIIKITKESLEDVSIVNELNTTKITAERFKDPEATFTHGAMHYLFKNINSHRLFEVIDSDDSKCYSSIDMSEVIENDSNLSSGSTFVCNVDGLKLILNETDKERGSFKIDSEEREYQWVKTVVFDNYPIIELNVTTTEEKHYFIASYDGSVYIGNIIEKENQERYFNTEAFNAIYTQLHDENRGVFETYQKLKDNYYEVSYYGGKQGYKLFSVDNEDRLNSLYTSFNNDVISANWILTKDGLKRESLFCDSEFYFHGYNYSCEDGRRGSISFSRERSLKNELIDTYLHNQGIEFSLENKNRFFSLDAKELTFKQKNLSGESYIFNVDGSYDIGTQPLKNDASSITENRLFITGKDKEVYAKFIGLDKGDSGVVEFYDMNASLESDKKILLSAKRMNDTTEWRRSSLGGKTILEISNSSELLKIFHTQNSIAIIEFMLRTPQLISGVHYEESNETIQKYLNVNAYENISDNIK